MSRWQGCLRFCKRSIFSKSQIWYCKMGNLRENFIFANGIKSNICHVKNLQQGHNLHISVYNNWMCLRQFRGIYFDNVMLTLHNVTLTSKKPCQHNNKCDCRKTNGYRPKWSLCFFSIKYCYSDILLKNT